jgi:hypothetical protein
VRFERSGYLAQMLLLRPDEDRTIGPITLMPAPSSEAPSTSAAKTNVPQGATKKTRPINSALLVPDEFK